jgi:hypothetical protein
MEREMPAPKKSLRPRMRPDDIEEGMAVRRGNRAAEREAKDAESLMKREKGGKMKMVKKGGQMVPEFAADGVGKMREGGMCRGMGAATKGGSFRMG